MIEIKSDKNEIYIEEFGEIIARIQFIPSGTDVNGQDLIIVNHTVVYNGQNGRGVSRCSCKIENPNEVRMYILEFHYKVKGSGLYTDLFFENTLYS